MKKKRIVIIISLIILLVIILLIYMYITSPKIYLINNLNTEVFADTTNLSYITKIENGTIITKEEKIDTTSLGKKEITLDLKNKLGIKKEYKFTINIVDTTAPTITSPDSLEVNLGEEINLIENVTVNDNLDKNLEVKIEGDYDISTPGEYIIYYVSEDKSGNNIKKECKLTVLEKPRVDSNGLPLPPDRKFTTSKCFQGETKDGLTYIDGILIANKTYSLPSDYGNGLTQETLNAFNKMKNDASNEGLNIYISSGFRSYDTQDAIYNRYVRNDGKEEADTYSARPGHSEHQTGLAYDVNIIDSSFDNTEEAIWLANNCYKYGFILRYPKGKTNETGYIYESWHFRYIGDTKLTEKLYNNGNWITLEDYFGITSVYEGE